MTLNCTTNLKKKSVSYTQPHELIVQTQSQKKLDDKIVCISFNKPAKVIAYQKSLRDDAKDKRLMELSQ